MRSDPRHDQPVLYCVEIRSNNWRAAVEWYRQVLQLRVLVRVVDDGYALLGAGETRIAVLARANPGDSTHRISFAFEVADLDPVLDRLRQLDVPLRFPKKQAEGLREVNLTDLDGNRIRLFAWPRNS